MSFSTKMVAIIFVLASPLMIMISAEKVEISRWRLKLAEKSCWDALLELQSCSGEVVMFFLNGEAHIGPNCCSAIAVIEHQCWPAMLGTLGITPEESNVLRGYCDATAAAAPPPSAFKFPRLLH